MRGLNGDGATAVNNTLETINAAASAISSAQNRVSQPTLQKKRWGGFLSIYWCFGYQKNRKRIGHAVLVPETTPSAGADPAAAVSLAPALSTLPFIAPPSSPASFFQSEPPSIAQSPTGILSFSSVSASMYSPSGPASIFAIGPYAHETQLVSPPVFSTFTTEPSTAPFTPPPESVHLTTPSSPEVPFAQLLVDPKNRNDTETRQRLQLSHYDFHSYQLHPGSPVGQLISPRSCISASGTSSPFPDCGSSAGSSHILDFQAKLLNCENQKSHQGSGSITPDAIRSTSQAGFLPNHWLSEIKMSPNPGNNCLNEISVNQRVSFELSARKVLRCAENKPVAWAKVMSKLKIEAARVEEDENTTQNGHDDKLLDPEIVNDAQQQSTLGGDKATVHQKDQSLSPSSAKEFNFDNADGGDSPAPNIVADWWANEKFAGKGGGTSTNWALFPVNQVSTNQ